MKILIIDDEEEILRALADQLNDLGHEVVEACTIQEAEQVWNGCAFALIDLMKGSNDFAKKIKGFGVKTISFSGFNKIKSEHKDAFDGILTKPWEDEELINLIK